MAPRSRTADQIISEFATRQHGCVTRAQLLGAQVTDDEIRERRGKGLLIPVFPGVYRVGHRAPSTEALYMAAVLACGKGALLGERAAAHLYELLKGRAPRPVVYTLTERDIAGIDTRRIRATNRPAPITWRGIPITSVPQTLVDLAATLPIDDLAYASHQAEVLHGTAPAYIDALLARRRYPGAAKLRAIWHGDHPTVLSKLEAGFLKRLREAGLPIPKTNRPQGAHWVDCRWPGLTVELDSYRFHHSRHAWEQDRQRERGARQRGDEFRRYTWADVFEEPGPMLAELTGLLPGTP